LLRQRRRFAWNACHRMLGSLAPFGSLAVAEISEVDGEGWGGAPIDAGDGQFDGNLGAVGAHAVHLNAFAQVRTCSGREIARMALLREARYAAGIDSNPFSFSPDKASP